MASKRKLTEEKDPHFKNSKPKTDQPLDEGDVAFPFALEKPHSPSAPSGPRPGEGNADDDGQGVQSLVRHTINEPTHSDRRRGEEGVRHCSMCHADRPFSDFERFKNGRVKRLCFRHARGNKVDGAPTHTSRRARGRDGGDDDTGDASDSLLSHQSRLVKESTPPLPVMRTRSDDILNPRPPSASTQSPPSPLPHEHQIQSETDPRISSTTLLSPLPRSADDLLHHRISETPTVSATPRNAIQRAQSRVLSQSATASRISAAAFAYTPATAHPQAPSTVTPSRPVPQRKYVAGSQAVWSVATGARLTAGQANANAQRWSDEETAALHKAKEDHPHMTLHEIHQTFFPQRSYHSMRSHLWRTQEREGQTRTTLPPADGMQLFVQANGVLTAGEARMFKALPAGYRSSADGHCHHLFQYHTRDTPDLSDLSTTWADWSSAGLYARKGSIPSAQRIDFNRVLAQSLMDFNSQMDGRPGKMCCAPGGINYFCLTAWSEAERTTYRRLSPLQRFHTLSAMSDTLWNATDVRVLPVLVADAAPIDITADSLTFEASFVVPHYLFTAHPTNNTRLGPLILVFLANEVLFCTIRDIADCTRSSFTGGMCTQVVDRKGNTKVKWKFQPGCGSYRVWSSGRKVDLSRESSKAVVDRLLATHALTDPLHWALHLQYWSTAYRHLLR